MRKQTVPIVSGNVKYLGLSIPEWVITLSPAGIYVIILDNSPLYFAGLIHFILIFIYIFFISKLEESILQIILTNRRIPDIVYGYFRKPLPINKLYSSASKNE